MKPMVFFLKKQPMCFCDHLHVTFGWLSAAYLLPGSSCILQSAMSTLGSWYCEVAKVLPPFHQSTAGFLGIYIPSLKPTASLHLKMGAPWKRRFLLESNIFWVRTVSFRECIWWRLREFGHPLVLRNNLGEVVASCGDVCGSFFLLRCEYNVLGYGVGLGRQLKCLVVRLEETALGWYKWVKRRGHGSIAEEWLAGQVQQAKEECRPFLVNSYSILRRFSVISKCRKDITRPVGQDRPTDTDYFPNPSDPRPPLCAWETYFWQVHLNLPTSWSEIHRTETWVPCHMYKCVYMINVCKLQM